MRLNIDSDHSKRVVGWCEELYRARAAELVLYGRALGLSHGEAEDVLQDTFIAMLARETAPLQPLHYCLRSYRNRALNYRRSLWRRLTREIESKRWFEADPAHPEETRAMEALAQLPVEQREVIVLRVWHRYTFEEIAELQQVSPNTVSGRYRYGIDKLRKSLKSNIYEDRNEQFGDAFAFLGAPASLREP